MSPVLKNDSSVVPLHRSKKKKYMWGWTKGLGCSEENLTVNYFLQEMDNMGLLGC